jgi:diamine N-acetyltransferase
VPTIRYAQADDAKQLSVLAEETFRATFGAANTAEHMDQHCTESYSQELQAREISNPGMRTLLCEDNGCLIGFAQLKWGQAPSCVAAKSPGEIQRLYVASAWHGKGVAQQLMAACLSEIKQRESDAVWLGVWEQNPRAISFYKKLGFVEVGAHIFPLGDDPQRDIVMVRPIADG